MLPRCCSEVIPKSEMLQFIHCIPLYTLVYAGRDVMEVAREIVATITDPSAMVGPEVCSIIVSTRKNHNCMYCPKSGFELRPPLTNKYSVYMRWLSL